MQMEYIIVIITFLFLGILFWNFFIKKPKEELLNFPKKWKHILGEKVNFYRRLSKLEKPRFEQAILHFLDRVTITGVEVEVEDVDKILVASSAVIPLFGFPGWEFRNINEVMLYKGTFGKNFETEGGGRNILGMVGSGNMNRLMILSKPALHEGFEKESKSNVGIHEFVHLIDKADGAVDGLPEVLMKQQYVIPWLHLMHEEIEKIRRGDSSINPYAAKNEAEFLSVVSEYFFNHPKSFKAENPKLYELLLKMYGQTT